MNATVTPASAQPLAMPYPGLRPFEEADHALFFGREEQVSDLLRQLEDASFVAVVGSSGSGKSSLVRAGLLPAMREGFLFGTTDWRIAVIKPGHEPYQRLAHELAECLFVQSSPHTPCAEIGIRSVPSTLVDSPVLKTLRRSDRGLLAAVDAAGIGTETHVLVVVDQFEELFAFRRAGAVQDNVASRDEAAAFVAMLLCTAANPDSRVHIVLTMRSDFIGDCEAFLGLPEAISRSQLLVPRLNRSQMEAAIVRPGEIRNAGFQPFTFEEGLVNQIINDAGDRPDQLPLMQHALMRTWKLAVARAGAGSAQVTRGDYEKTGGIEQALSKHADAAWEEISNDRLRQIAQRMFLLLCDVSPDGHITRRQPRVSEVMAVTGAKLDEVEAVVRAFQQDDRNFLLPPAPTPLTEDTELDLSHEALLSRWGIFAKWLDEERRDVAELRRLAELADLHYRKQGDLISGRDLSRISEWAKRVSLPWSRRYVSESTWNESQAFLAASRKRTKRIRVSIFVALLLT